MLFSKFNTEHHNFPGLQIEALRKMEYNIFNLLVKTRKGLADKYLSCLALFSVNVQKGGYCANSLSVST